ncbi:TIGR02444 family protein [Pseudomonas berkeleyensis]|uniref:TIGR02444 family protein n=1 Tax=Pseudomonas berkeleyensis TaxID=2726956 RepID=A0A7G5DPY1_9PSED|nr:TIGR02444 family protein [Pseudomonas berkeleyensis]QMV63806.1 TIGR02444 family protein [Pseudomonas berkeleyensis]WSO39273.1 TIGR02444 family protein [Pseudomonas berkeleyensis]
MQDLWNFAVQLYARPGVESACLQLQDSGCDVCLVLTGAWLEQRGIPCRDDYLQALRDLAQPWQQNVVMPLRQARQQWRTAASQDAELATLREQLKQLELEAERLLLKRLEALTKDWPNESAGSDWLRHLVGNDNAALQVLRGAVITR